MFILMLLSCGVIAAIMADGPSLGAYWQKYTISDKDFTRLQEHLSGTKR